MQESENWYARRNFYAPRNHPRQELLPDCANCIAEMRNFSYDPRPASWKAGTLPLSYSRKNHSYFILNDELYQKVTILLNL